MSKNSYLTNLSDAEWEILHPLFPSIASTGRPREHSYRTILNAILYVVRAGCQWRLLPKEFPAWQTVYHYFRLWRLDGTWERLHTTLREQVRQQAGREAQPSAGIIDSQSVKTTSVGGPRGYDGGKKLSGRKRHLLVDTQGLVLRVRVHPANEQDRAAVAVLLTGAKEQFPRLSHVWADQGYTGRGKAWIEEQLGWSVAVVQHPSKSRGQWVPHGDLNDLSTVWFSYERFPSSHIGFRGVLPRRWVVERTFSWFGQNRRLSKDYERVCSTSEAWIYVTMLRIMVRRLAKQTSRPMAGVA